MEGFIGVLVALILMVFSGTSQQVTPEPPQIPEQPTTYSPVVIEDVRAMILKSYPAQIVLQIDGHLPDGCNFPVQITQQRNGSTITLDVYHEVPSGVMCPAIFKEYHDSVHLDGTFESGTYTIVVNGYTTQVTI
jgi:hypothetical protein